MAGRTASRASRVAGRVSEHGAARWTDCSNCVDDADTSWIDATHPSPLGTRQLAARLAAKLTARS